MTTIGGSWGAILVIDGSLLLFLGLIFLLITRPPSIRHVWLRCPRTGFPTSVQHIADERGFLTDVVSCAAFPKGQAITCGLPCLTRGVRACVSVSRRAEDLVPA